MPRRRQLRRIVAPPKFEGYRPFGCRGKGRGQAVELLYEEYEALKLADYDGMNHLQASKLMGISRATFARIYESARKKIALALVETRPIQTVYGNVTFDRSWRKCKDCHSRFSPVQGAQEGLCPLCKSDNTEAIANN